MLISIEPHITCNFRGGGGGGGGLNIRTDKHAYAVLKRRIFDN